MSDRKSSTKPTHSPLQARHLVITVHGIRTYGKWQDRLETLLKNESGDAIDVRSYRYGYFSSIAFMIPFLRWIVTRRFRTELLATCSERAWSRVDIVAHSFGTHIVCWALHSLLPHDCPSVHTIILAGSVLKPTFPWKDLFPGNVSRVTNECGAQDSVLVLNQLTVLFMGMAGRVGFSAMEGNRFRNRFFNGGHSCYFLRTDQTEQDDFMRDYWIPLLTSDNPIIPSDQRTPPTKLGGVREVALKHFEPVKLAIYGILVLGSCGWLVGQWTETQKAKRRATTEQLKADRALMENAMQDGVIAWSTAETAARSMSDPIRASHYFLAAAAAFEKAGDQNLAQNALLAAELAARHIVYTITHESHILGAQYSPMRDKLLTWSRDGTARLCNAANGNPIGFAMRHHDWVNGSIFSPNGKQVLTWSRDGSANLWDSADTRSLITNALSHNSPVLSASFSPDGTSILTRCTDKAARLWKVTDGTLVRDFKQDNSIAGAIFSPDGQLVATWSTSPADGARVHRVFDGKTASALLQHEGGVIGAVFSKNSQQLLTWGEDAKLRLWAAPDWTQARELTNGINSGGACFSEDGESILTWPDSFPDHNSARSRVRLWRASTGEELIITNSMCLPTGCDIKEADFSADQRLILAWGNDAAQVWNIEDGSPVCRDAIRFPYLVNQATLSTDGATWVACSGSGGRLWSAGAGFEFGLPIRHMAAITGSEFAPDSERVVTWGEDGALRMWSPFGTSDDFPTKNTEHVTQSRIHTNGQLGVTWGWTLSEPFPGTASLWNFDGDQVRRRVVEHGCRISQAIFNKDGEYLLFLGENETATLWRVADTNLVLDAKSKSNTVHSGHFSDDGRFLVLQSKSGDMWVYDAPTGSPVLATKHFDDRPANLAFNPNGQQLLAWSGGQTKTNCVVIWSFAEPTRPVLLHGHEGRVLGAKFSKDGRCLLTRTSQTVRLWRASDGMLISHKIRSEGARIEGAVFEPKEAPRRILTWGENLPAQLWDVSIGTSPIGDVMRMNGFLAEVGFSPGGELVFTSNDEGVVALWDARDGTLRAKSVQHTHAVTGFRFSPDGQMVLTWSGDGTARVWRPFADGAIDHPLVHDHQISGASFSRDGKKVISWDNSSVKIWDVSDSRCIGTLINAGSDVSAVLSADEKRVIADGAYSAVKVWDISRYANVPLRDLVLELEVRSGTTLGSNGEIRVLKPAELEEKRRQLAKRPGGMLLMGRLRNAKNEMP